MCAHVVPSFMDTSRKHHLLSLSRTEIRSRGNFREPANSCIFIISNSPPPSWLGGQGPKPCRTSFRSSPKGERYHAFYIYKKVLSNLSKLSESRWLHIVIRPEMKMDLLVDRLFHNFGALKFVS